MTGTTRRDIWAGSSWVGSSAPPRRCCWPPRPAEIRDQLLEHGGEFAKRAQELANDAQGRAGDWLDKSREVFEEQTQRLMTAFEAGKDAMKEEIRKGNTPPRG